MNPAPLDYRAPPTDTDAEASRRRAGDRFGLTSFRLGLAGICGLVFLWSAALAESEMSTIIAAVLGASAAIGLIRAFRGLQMSNSRRYAVAGLVLNLLSW